MNYFDRLKVQSGNGAAETPESRIVRDIAPPRRSRIAARPKRAGPHRPPPRSTSDINVVPVRRAPPETAPPLPTEHTDDLDIAIKTWEPERGRRARLRRNGAVAVSTAAVLLGFALPTFVFPKFSVTTVPKLDTVAASAIEIVADPAAVNVDAANRRIPAMLIETDKTITQEYPATGKKFIQDRARGTIRITNAFSSAPQPLVANTRFQDLNGKIFRLPQGVVVPGAKVEGGKIVPTSVAAAVVADAPGTDYNIGPTEFRIPGFRGSPRYDGFHAKSEESFSGGFTGEATIVQSQDIARASEDLTRRVFEGVRNELQRKIPTDQDFLAPDGGREITIVKIDQPKPGDHFERFPMSVTARGRLVIIRRSHLSAAIAPHLLPMDRDAAPRIADRQPDLTIINARFSTGGTEFRFAADGKLAYWRMPDLDELTKTLRASTPLKAEAYLRSRDEIGSFVIKRFPRWLWFVPTRAAGLEVRIQPPT